jgi:SAM-dependent methyltransferase
MRAIYTYWTDGKDISVLNAGFNNMRDMAVMVTISIRKLKENNPKITSVHLVTNTIGKELFADRYPVPFDQVDVILDSMDGRVHPDHWAYAKLMAYAAQDGPFIHIDCDVILWKALPEALTSAPLFFQNKEFIDIHDGYTHNINKAKDHLPADIRTDVEWAYNCGIVGSNRPDLMRRWLAMADEFIFSPANAAYWQHNHDRHSTNHLFEQYFISSIVATEGTVPGVLLPDFQYGMEQDAITHLWGDSKRGADVMARLYARLQREYPTDYAAIMAETLDHADVFTSIYRQKHWGEGSGGGSSEEQTAAYRQFLSDFILKKKVKSVVDLGCGYWAFNELINWHGAAYTGIDVVDAVQGQNRAKSATENRHFITGDIRTCDIPKCDLLIIKDVLIHWTNAEVITFFGRKLPAKHILITNDDRVQEVNTDISVPGQYRDIDITKKPFNIKAKVVMDWGFPHKSTWLLSK